MRSRKPRSGLFVVGAALSVAAAAMVAGLAGGAGSAAAAPTSTTFTATLSGAQEVPPNASTATGSATVVLNDAQTMITVSVSFSGLTTNATGAHIHEGAPGVAGPIVFALTGVPETTSGSVSGQTFSITPAQVDQLEAGNYYVNVHSSTFPGGEIRGQLAVPTAVRIGSASAARVPAGVLVRWRTASELETVGFNLYREQSKRLLKVNRTLIRSTIAATTRGHAYSWLDRGAPAGKLRYRLQSVDVRGTRTWVASASVASRYASR